MCVVRGPRLRGSVARVGVMGSPRAVNVERILANVVRVPVSGEERVDKLVGRVV